MNETVPKVKEEDGTFFVIAKSALEYPSYYL